MHEADPGPLECELQPLSQLTGLVDLSIAACRCFAASTLASISMLKQLASLELQLDKDNGDFSHIFPHLSSLWGLSHLTHLSCIHIDTAPLHVGGMPDTPVNPRPREAAVPKFDFSAMRGMITALVGCQNLMSLQLPWANFMGRYAERLATELTRLTRLSVNGIWPTASMPPCSWRELTLCRKQTLLCNCLVRLPLEGLDCLCVSRLALLLQKSINVDAFVNAMEQQGPLLVAKLWAANNNGPRLHSLSFRCYLDSSAQLTRIIPALTVFDVVVDALTFSFCTKLEGSHMWLLATALPGLAHFTVCEPGLIDDDAWACIGTLPGLKTFSIIDDGTSFPPQHPKEPFNPRHMALLASSVTRPLTVTVAQSDAEMAAVALKALQAEGHVAGAGLITLHQREA